MSGLFLIIKILLINNNFLIQRLFGDSLNFVKYPGEFLPIYILT